MRPPTLVLALLAFALLAPAAPAAAQVEARIVGGTMVAAGDYPWQVAMLSAGGLQYCGGTLVAPDWVLTARHCEATTDEQVRLGSTNRTSGGQVIGIAEVKNHPLSFPGTDTEVPRYDVTMVRLDTAETDPVAVPLTAVTPGADDALWAPGDDLTVTGWGRTSDGGNTTNNLREAVVPRVSDATCSSAYGGDFSSSDMVCAGTGATDTCQGDSGGPIIAPTVDAPDKSDPDHWRQVGITSWGGPCASALYPGVYARLGNALVSDWTSLIPAVADTPTLTGGSRAGEDVTCSRGSWTGRAYFTYRFFREGGTTPVATNTTGTYRLADGDVGSRIFCRVRGENVAAVVNSPDSNLSATIGARPLPTNSRAPVLTGQAIVGSELRCEPGSWEGASSLAYGFRRVAPGGSPILVTAGSPTYVPTAADVGSQILCFETATNSFGSAEASSAAVGPVVAAAAPPLDPQPRPEPAPQPPVLTPRDQGAPQTTRVSRRCQRRRCTLSLFTKDTTTAGARSAGVLGVEVKLTSRYSCVKARRRQTCTRRRTLKASATATPGVFRVRTGLLPRGRHTFRMIAVDAAGNRQAVALTYAFRLRR